MMFLKNEVVDPTATSKKQIATNAKVGDPNAMTIATSSDDQKEVVTARDRLDHHLLVILKVKIRSSTKCHIQDQDQITQTQ